MRPFAARSCDAIIAVDTNVLVRLLTGDNPGRKPLLAPCIGPNQSGSPKPYCSKLAGYSKVCKALRRARFVTHSQSYMGLRNVHAEDESSVADALAFKWRTELN